MNILKTTFITSLFLLIQGFSFSQNFDINSQEVEAKFAENKRSNIDIYDGLNFSFTVDFNAEVYDPKDTHHQDKLSNLLSSTYGFTNVNFHRTGNTTKITMITDAYASIDDVKAQITSWGFEIIDLSAELVLKP